LRMRLVDLDDVHAAGEEEAGQPGGIRSVDSIPILSITPKLPSQSNAS
jgi:hypothetical protein